MGKEEELILKKIKEKADNLDLKFDRKVFVANFLPAKEVQLWRYMNGSPRFKGYGSTIWDRSKNLHRFLKTKESRASIPGGVGVNRKGIIDTVNQIKNPKDRKMIERMLSKLDFNRWGDTVVVTRLNIPGDPGARYDILLHEWVHVLLVSNKIGFWDTGNGRWKYNEGATIAIEYYMGNYYGRDIGFLKERMASKSQDDSFMKILKFTSPFIKIIEGQKRPEERKRLILKYFNSIHAPKRARL